MKVIVASLPKTGTKTVSASLRILGFKVDDFIEQYERHEKQWNQILSYGYTTQEFQKMYEDVDAVVDVPACAWWEEIHRAFPDAKIILTMRESEDIWLKSLNNQFSAFDGWSSYLRNNVFLSKSMLSWFRLPILKASGYQLKLKPSLPYPIRARNDMMCRYWYRRHNAHVLQNAPKDKLLVWDLSDGWEPLCKFLGKPVPSVPFPHSNKAGSEVQKIMTEHPVLKRERLVRRAELGMYCATSLFLLYHFSTNTKEESFIYRGLLAISDTLLNKLGYYRQ